MSHDDEDMPFAPVIQPGSGVVGVGKDVKRTLGEGDAEGQMTKNQQDVAYQEFAEPSLRDITNQYGVSKPFHLEPHVKAISSDFPYSEKLVTTKQPVPTFWTYDGAYPNLIERGKVATSVDQVLPNRRITEQDCIEWNRVGSKKGWMFNGPPMENKPGFHGENKPTHTDDGFIDQIAKNKYFATPRSMEKQGMATREMPKVDIYNNARGIGVTGQNSGNGGMAGGYHEVTPGRLSQLPIPMERFCWTGSRVQGTARTDSTAGGRRSGYDSVYPSQPYLPIRRSFGVTNPTQTAA